MQVTCNSDFMLSGVEMHLICIYIVPALQVFPHFMWLYISCTYCTWSLGIQDDYLRMIIPAMKWPVWSVIIEKRLQVLY